MKQVKKLLSISLAVLVLLSGTPVFADNSNYKKEENVYAISSADGKVEKEIVSTWVHSNDGKIDVEQKSSLSDVKNIKSDDEISLNNGKISFKTDSSDIYYRGSSDKKLPFETSVKYYLDGKEEKAENMLGKTGKAKIEISFKNTKTKKVEIGGEEEEIYLPLVVVGSINLPVDTFKNVEYNKGKLVNDAKNQLLTFVSTPGLKDNFDFESEELIEKIDEIDSTITIEADVEDFHFDSIMLIATNEMPDFSNVENLDTLSEKVEDLKSKGKDLYSATSKLSEGQKIFAEKLSEYLAGTTKIAEGTKGLKAGSDALSEKSAILAEGAKKIKEASVKFILGISGFSEGSSKYAEGAKAFSQGASEFAKGAGQVADATSALVDKTQALADGSSKLDEGVNKLKVGMETANLGFEEMTTGIKASATASAEALQKQIEAYQTMLAKSEEGIQALKMLQVPDEQKPIVAALVESMEKQKAGLNLMIQESQAKLLAMQNSEMGTKIDALLQGYKNIYAGLEELSEGSFVIKEGTGKLAMGVAGLKEAKTKLSEASKKLSPAANALAEASQKISEGAGMFGQGGEEYKQAVGQFADGVDKFHNEGVLAIAQAANQLDVGVSTLVANNDALIAAQDMLKNGSSKLNVAIQTAIGQEVDEDVDVIISDINKIGEVQEYLRNFGNENLYFSENYKGAEQSVKYIVKIKGIK